MDPANETVKANPAQDQGGASVSGCPVSMQILKIFMIVISICTRFN